VKNHYETLGVGPDADVEQIKSAFRRIAKECHPDRTSDPAAHAHMSAASAAWSALKDAASRAEYDADLAAQAGRPRRRAKEAEPSTLRPCTSCGEHAAFQQSTKCWRCLLRDTAQEESRRRAEGEAKRRVEAARASVEASRTHDEAARARDEAARARAEASRRRRQDAQTQAKMREQALNEQRRNAESATNLHGYDDPIHAPNSDTLFEAILSESALRAARGVQKDGVNVWLHMTPDMRLEAKGSTVDLAKEVHKGLRQANRLLDRVSKWFGGR
jgi:curved DNA-binding protein CbpA